MQITKVSYGKTYNLGNYCSHRIDLEASLDEGENEQLVLAELKQQCDLFHTSNIPTSEIPYQEQDTKYQHPISEINNYNTFDTITPQPIEKQLTKEEQYKLAILSVTDTKELEKIWYKIAHNPKYPSLKNAYDLKAEQLITSPKTTPNKV